MGGIRRLQSNFPVIDDYLGGVATSIKSIDLTSPTYQSAAALTSRIRGYARKLSSFQGASLGEILVPPDGEKILERGLVIAYEPGAGTFRQGRVFAELSRWARNLVPPVKIQLVPIP